MSENGSDQPSIVSFDVQAAHVGSVGSGIGWLVVAHLVGQIILSPLMGFVWISLSQLIYVIPMAISFSKKGESETIKGLWIGAGITVLLNAACFGIILFSLSKTNFH